ncbi:MAG: helix-turn-helix transcriptional regulator [Chloroflexota bacterium]|nr:helix-turn-helix transcriptional regulator [Chloroflexota bacterium]
MTRPPRFTAQYRAVLAHIGEGCTTAEIAERLGTTPDTAANYVRGVTALVAQRGRYEAGVEEWPLSRREAEVQGLLKEGLTDPQIASRLGIGVRTAESHVASVRRKLGVRSRKEADAEALTRRQQQVRELVEHGRTNDQIAAELGISVRTVQNLVGQVLARTGLRRRRDLQPPHRSPKVEPVSTE